MSLINIIGKQKRGVIALSIKVKNIKYYDVCKECEFLYHCYGREIAERIQNDQTDDMYLRPGVCSDFFYVSNNKKHSLEVIMKLVNATVLGNLVSAHYEHDEKKFAAYVQFIIDAYEERGEKRQAEIIRKRMDGSYKLQSKVSLENIEISDEFSKM